ncbi:heavy metal-binding domain-containing protein, partial [Aegicerativicinus sediminis]
YCQKCGNDLLSESSEKMKAEIAHYRKQLDKAIFQIPVVTTHSPHGWDYKTIGIVTGQSTMGTGVLTELTSSITDAFGVSSGRHNTKLKKGEDLCLAQLRSAAYEMGGNAIIGTDIDYSEIGSGKGILMVCMAGTVVNLQNTEVLDRRIKVAIEDIPRILAKLKPLEKLVN